jgi:phosphonopyruvate decarboxylase
LIEAKILLNQLKKNKIEFFTGVPDSILKSFSNELEKKNYSKKNIITANEGSAIATGIGYYLANKKIPCIYFQNSGLGNAINPLISIAHKKVYSIPMLLIVGWRGAPKIKDEPQHITKGKITTKLLKLLNIKYIVLEKESDLKKLNELIKYAKKNFSQVACLVKKNILTGEKKYKKINKSNVLREDFLNSLLNKVKKNSAIISTTGYTSRELFQIRKNKNFLKGKDFYMVGGMGHASSVAASMSKFSNKQTICIDGDGSFLMHMGSIVTTSHIASNKFKYIILNNNVHESVGSQKTSINVINLKKFSDSIRFKNYFLIKDNKKLKSTLERFLKVSGPSFLEVKIKNISMKNLERPKNFQIIKKNFLKLNQK